MVKHTQSDVHEPELPVLVLPAHRQRGKVADRERPDDHVPGDRRDTRLPFLDAGDGLRRDRSTRTLGKT